jgi:hypothetical protein
MNLHTPPFVKVAAGVIMCGVAGVTVTAVMTSNARHELQRKLQHEACESTVDNRDDSRAMWLFLIAANEPDRADDPDVVAFVEYLNRRLPPLECVGVSLIPVEVSVPE